MPTGCLAVLLVAITFVATAFFLALGIIKQTDAFKLAFSRVERDPAVIAALASPIKARKIISGSIHAEGPSGEAHFSIPIGGPKGKGKIYVDATKSAGLWQFSTLIVEIDKTGERIDLNREPQ